MTIALNWNGRVDFDLNCDEFFDNDFTLPRVAETALSRFRDLVRRRSSALTKLEGQM